MKVLPLSFEFNDPDILHVLESLSQRAVDALAFGVIGFHADSTVRRYNLRESHMSGMAVVSVIGTRMFDAVAPCMNNFMEAQRFEDATAKAALLDVKIGYVLTLRSRPTPVRSRLLSSRYVSMRYILVERH